MAEKNVSVKLANGCSMPLFGLGTWKSKQDEVRKAVVEAIQAGYRHIDCALAYGNEDEVGAALKEKFTDGTVKREDVFVTTKLWNAFHHPDDVEDSCKKSLKDLGLDYIDLYLMHWPMSFKRGNGMLSKDADGMVIGDDTDFVDTWKAMESLVEKGLVKAIGVSNFNISQMQRILDLPAKQKICNIQIEVTPYLPGKETLAFCKANNILMTAYSPLGSPDRPVQAGTDPVLLEDPVLVEIAKAKGRTPAQIAIRYHIDRGVAVIPKSVTPSRIRENFEVLDFELTSEEVEQITALDRNFHFITFGASKNCKYYPF